MWCLADAARGRGLGGAVTLLGIGYLIEGGAQAVDLYVEGDNAAAVATYRRLASRSSTGTSSTGELVVTVHPVFILRVTPVHLQGHGLAVNRSDMTVERGFFP